MTLLATCLLAGNALWAEPTSNFAQGAALLGRGAPFTAVRVLRLALAEGDSRAHFALAQAYFVLNQHRFFREEIAEAKRNQPSDAEPYYVEGRFLFQNESKFDAAATQFQKALFRDPNHIKALCYLGISLMNMQEPVEAEAHLLKAVEQIAQQKSSFYLPFQTLALLYIQQDQLEKAAAAVDRAVALAPQVALNQFLLGKIAWARNSPAGAIPALQAAIALDDAFLEARYLLARILKSQGKTAEGERQLAQFKALKEIYGVASRQ